MQSINQSTLRCGLLLSFQFSLALHVYPLLKLHPTPIGTTQHKRQPLPLTPNWLILLPFRQADRRKSLQKPHDSVRNLHEREILTKTRPRTTIERKVSPTVRACVHMLFPSLRAEVICIWSKNVLSTGVDVLREDHDFSLSDKYGRRTIRSAAPG